MKKAHSVSTSQPTAPAHDKAERAGRMLDRLAEMAMEQAEVTHQALLAATRAGEATPAKEFGLAFDRAGRTVRRALALKFRLVRDRQEMADKAAARARDRAAEKAERRRQVAGLVTSSITAAGSPHRGDLESASAGMWERLIEDDDIDAALAMAGHPIEEIVIRPCREMRIPAVLILPEDAAGPAAEDPPTVPPNHNPEWWRFVRLIPTAEGRQVGEPYWWDAKLKQRVDQPPWEPEAEPDDDG